MALNPLKSFNLGNVYKKICGDKPGSLVDKIKPFIEKNAQQAVKEWRIAKKKMKDIPGTNYELGLLHLRNGNLDDAILRFKMVIFLVPERADAYYNLARCLIVDGDKESAEENLQKALSLKTDFAEAKYMMEKIKSPESVGFIPANIVAEHIEWWNKSSSEEIDARSQRDKILISMALENIKDKNPNLKVLDLGCGHGGRGVILKSKEVAHEVVGIDLWEKATAKAKAEKFQDEDVYSAIYKTEILSYLPDNQEKYDLIMAGDIFSYQGNLDNVFGNIAKSLVTGGLLAIIINNDVEEASYYKLDITKDKFIHSLEYFEETMKKAGFSIEDKKEKKIADTSFEFIIAKMEKASSTVTRDLERLVE